MRALIITCSVWHPRLPLNGHGATLVAGPHWPDAQSIHGVWRSLRTSDGDYDLAEVLAKIPAEQYPEMLLCLGDARGRCRPRNLRAFAGLKLFLYNSKLTDAAAKLRLERYLALEGYDKAIPEVTSASIAAALHDGGGFLPTPCRSQDASLAPFHDLRLRAS